MRLSDLTRIGEFSYNWRRILPRVFRRIALGFVAVIGFITFYTVLQVQTAVAGGALQTAPFECIEAADRHDREALVDRTFARAVAVYLRPEEGGSTEWHVQQVLALWAGKLLFSKDERKALVMPALDALPVCPARSR